ncbi:MAG: cell division protein SepF [Ilumatobacteraceae bacterium]|jgi:cell division inhibitor SepF
MSMWKRAMDYLGLGPESAYDDYDEYDEYDEYEEPERPSRPSRTGSDYAGRGAEPHQPRGRGGAPGGYPSDPSSRGIPRAQVQDGEVVVRRAHASGSDSQVQPRPSNPRPPLAAVPSGGTEPHTVSPRRFDSAQEIADRFKQGYPVIMNLEAADREVSRRLIDFASGLCYGLGGTMEKVATGVYLLKPAARTAYGDA